MTVEDMRNSLREYCDEQISCEDCKCKPNAYGNCYTCVNDETIRKNYRLVFGVDVVNHPTHYTQGGIECIEAMEAAFGAHELAVYCKIAAFKYIWRCEHKNGLEDIKKAVWYLNKYIELMERDGE
jgi:hypothetical protein